MFFIENAENPKMSGIITPLPLISLHLIVLVLQFDAHLLEHLLGFLSGMVAAFAYHAHDAAVDDEHGAGATWGHATI